MSKCKICLESFTPIRSSLEKTCISINCRTKWAIGEVEKQKLAKAKKIKQDWCKEKIELRQKLKSLTEWQKDLEKPINKICCLIDFGSGCISCNGITTPQAGHFHTVKSNPSIRYNFHNVHLQDYNCNCAKGGNIQKYDVGLIDRYGKEYWEFVKFDIVREYPLLKIAKHEYQEKIDKANSIIKWLQLQGKSYSKSERLELRKKYNLEIGIYNE